MGIGMSDDQIRQLHRAARQGQHGEVAQVLASGAPVDGRNPAGVTALGLAAMRGHLPVVTLLLEAGADPNASDAHGFSILMSAVEFPHAAVVRELINAGARVDDAAPDGRTPLLNAVWSAESNAAVVETVLRAGANTAARDAEEGLSAREWAERAGRSDMIAAFDKIAGPRDAS
ncbi:MAG TPA: ankyrin repeat domain-containing protein [Iamia sp.]